MTDIQEKAQALMDAMRAEYPEVSDGALEHLAVLSVLEQNKIKPDPLVEVYMDAQHLDADAALCLAIHTRAALEARGLEIRSKNDDRY